MVSIGVTSICVYQKRGLILYKQTKIIPENLRLMFGSHAHAEYHQVGSHKQYIEFAFLFFEFFQIGLWSTDVNSCLYATPLIVSGTFEDDESQDKRYKHHIRTCHKWPVVLIEHDNSGTTGTQPFYSIRLCYKLKFIPTKSSFYWETQTMMELYSIPAYMSLNDSFACLIKQRLILFSARDVYTSSRNATAT